LGEAASFPLFAPIHAEAGSFGHQKKGNPMTNHWDEFSKSLAEESVPRRESLRRLGAVFAGAVLSPLAFGLPTAWGRAPDPCKTFCNRCPKKQQSQCLAACQACNGNTSRLCGTCGNYACCASGLACCGGACVDVFEDFYNCGGCGNVCDAPGPYEDGACVDGTCLYQCVAGTTRCNGTCTPVLGDPNNCGACGNVCPASVPFCSNGTCTETYCNGADLLFDALNCGACGHQCQPLEYCSWGVCEGSCIGCE